jgi:hypothetical protein
MNKKVMLREGLILLATCGALGLLAMVLRLLGITLWPLVGFWPLPLLALAFYVAVRWRRCRRRCRS